MQIGEGMRARGHEFGVTTGRPRRCGWFDAVAMRYSNMINGYVLDCLCASVHACVFACGLCKVV